MWRMSFTRLAEQIMEHAPVGTQDTGRPCKKWLDL